MTYCNKFASLTIDQQRDYLNRVITAVQHNDRAFENGLEAIGWAQLLGVFNTVSLIDPRHEQIKDLDNPIER